MKTILSIALAIHFSSCAQEAKPALSFEAVNVPGTLLEKNPAGDPPNRRVASYSTGQAGAVPVLYLPGWGGSSEDSIEKNGRDWLGQTVARMAVAGNPVAIHSVDARSRYGGTQYLDSAATGNYAQWLVREVIPFLEKKTPVPAGKKWIIAGHSSGGFGALRLAMANQELFGAVVALSPDSDLGVTHIGFAREQSVQSLTPADVEAAMTGERMPKSGVACMMLGLSANYAPSGKPGRFEWIYDAGGKFRDDVWQRWIEQDPLTIVQKNAGAFSPAQRIYLDGAEHDEFGANIGARKIHEVLKTGKSPVEFLETPGHHSDLLPERLVRGLRWALGEKAPSLR